MSHIQKDWQNPAAEFIQISAYWTQNKRTRNISILLTEGSSWHKLDRKWQYFTMQGETPSSWRHAVDLLTAGRRVEVKLSMLAG